jgi:hypothetical protein
VAPRLLYTSGMKKISSKKLSLDTVTLKNLQLSDLSEVGGGSAEGTMCQTCTYTSAIRKCSVPKPL